jgi:predicted flap endonuclease-1-like 5' DNA nuclease
VKTLDTDLTGLRRRVGELEPTAALVPARNARITELEAMLREWDGRRTTWDRERAEWERTRAEWERERGELQSLRARLAELDVVSKEDPRDDLEAIYGVGPKLAKLLYSLGVNTFRQVASWNEADIEEMDAKLEDFHGRIRRENWVDSARTEYEKKYNRAFTPLRRS